MFNALDTSLKFMDNLINQEEMNAHLQDIVDGEIKLLQVGERKMEVATPKLFFISGTFVEQKKILVPLFSSDPEKAAEVASTAGKMIGAKRIPIVAIFYSYEGWVISERNYEIGVPISSQEGRTEAIIVMGYSLDGKKNSAEIKIERTQSGKPKILDIVKYGFAKATILDVAITSYAQEYLYVPENN